MAHVVQVAVAVLLLVVASPRAGAGLALDAAAPPLTARLQAFSSALDGVRTDGGQGGGGMMECWSALTELRSCTNEIVLFFLNGESYLGVECCLAIRTVTRHCWPAMLASIGFTAEEADVLRGFCDAEVGGHGPPPAAPAPAPAGRA